MESQWLIVVIEWSGWCTVQCCAIVLLALGNAAVSAILG